MANVTQGFSDNTHPTIAPLPTKEKGQRSLSIDELYIRRWVTPWAQPYGVSANSWRAFVKAQPIAMDCKETLQASLLGFDWSVTARDSTKRDELKGTIKHYTKLIDKGGEYFDFGYEGLVEWIISDFLDIPFGAGAEIGRRNDSPNGRVVWVKPLDGATLYPTGNQKTPVMQYYNGKSALFPNYAISRIYMSPSSIIEREGWGLAPPEKVYFAMEMLSRGDKYYANLLGESPPAGILDLGDMAQESALEWVSAFREFLHGNPSSFAIPVLYEHNTDVKFIPFGKVPNDIMYDRITLKYAAIVAAAYGVSLSDIGLQTTSASGETLAGSIRQERRTRRTGIARAKKAIKSFMEGFLPYSLQFNIIDPDEEVNLAQGRSRLANFTSFGQMLDKGIFSREEVRLQAIKDGLMSQDFPEEIPEGLEPLESTTPERPGTLGNPESAANGGQGEVRMSGVSVRKSENFDGHVKGFVAQLVSSLVPKYKSQISQVHDDELYVVRTIIENSIFGEDDVLEIGEQIKNSWNNKRWFRLKFDTDKIQEFSKIHGVDSGNLEKALQETFASSAKDFLGKSVAFLLKDILVSETVFDETSDANDNNNVNIVQNVYKSLLHNFDEYIQACLDIEVQNLLEKGL